ncbi:protein YCF54, chloroplastic-like [Aristolochia californica]|uniref:protein YCF54, chloroplastic-like n=1 Tax=Aristolochia californica TaxID=171875 RepID=UPI0035D6DA69
MAALSLGSCAGFPAIQSERAFPSISFPPKFISGPFAGRIKGLFLADKRSFSRSAAVTKAIAVDSNQLGSSDPAEQEKPKKYYFVVANAKFMLDEEEHFQELMFERLRNFEERNKEQDFWLLIEPKFLDKFPAITKRLKRPAVALVSTNGPWITFMKLRLDRVLAENFEADSLEEALASNPTELKFEEPEKWVAPYPKYEYGWWEKFLPPGAGKVQA